MRMYTSAEVAKILCTNIERVKSAYKTGILHVDERKPFGNRERLYFSEASIRNYAERVGITYDFDIVDKNPGKKKNFKEAGLWIVCIDNAYLDRRHYMKNHSFSICKDIKYTYLFDNPETPQKIVEAYGIGRVECLYMEQ